MAPKTTRDRLAKAEWFFFDLDDTLHSFRSASAAATTSTFQLILYEHPDLKINDFRTSSSHILKSSIKGAFVDGKTSHDYRAERFRLLLEDFGMKVSDAQMKVLLECYESTLMANLELNSHAVDLLQCLKSRGKKIAIVTEGPQDAQERTIAAVCLVPFVDYLATTNKLGVAKIDGMFPRVLQELGVAAEEVVMVGDSWDRDIMPAGGGHGVRVV